MEVREEYIVGFVEEIRLHDLEGGCEACILKLNFSCKTGRKMGMGRLSSLLKTWSLPNDRWDWSGSDISQA